MYKKGAGNDKQGKDAGNRTLCPRRNFSQAIKTRKRRGKSNTCPYRNFSQAIEKVGTNVRARALGISGVNFCPGIRYFRGQFRPGIRFFAIFAV